jgi:hypothetical protein
MFKSTYYTYMRWFKAFFKENIKMGCRSKIGEWIWPMAFESAKSLFIIQ